MNSPAVLDTERLTLHRLSDQSEDDCDFVLRLLNDEDFVRFIGDKQVRDRAQAAHYLRNGPMAAYAAHGYGLYRVARKSDGQSVGMCGLVRRDPLPHPDLGYALLPEWRGHGYVAEAGAAVLADAHARLGLTTVLAVVDPENTASIRTLRALGYTHADSLILPGETLLLHVYAWTPDAGAETP